MASEAAKVSEKEKPNIWDSIDTKIKHEGKHLVLPGIPGPMPAEDAIKTLKRYIEAENQRYDVMELVEGAPWDALVAVTKAMHEIYGVVIAESIQTFFGEIKPKLITINTGPEPDDSLQVAMGQMSLPNITAPVQVQLTREGTAIIGTVKRKDKQAVVDIAVLARKIMATDSIYKNKAIRLKVDDDGDLQLTEQPEFIQLRGVSETDIIHTKKTSRAIKNNIFSPLKHTDACRKHQIPLKKGILLHGKYGTGKSLTARVTAKVAIDNKWTFIMLDKAQGLGAAIEFARTYQPCVIFAEDIDRAADRDDESVNTLINLLDGVITKNMEMMVVLTTNFIEKIDRALLRPGRFDALISIDEPDAETVHRLIRHYGRDLVGPELDLTMACNSLAGQIPATIREVVERAKTVMLTEDRDHLITDDLVAIAEEMADHIALLAPKPTEDTPAVRLFTAMGECFAASAGFDQDMVDNITGEVSRIGRGQVSLAKTVVQRLEQTNSFAQAAAGSAESAKETAERASERAGAAREYAREDLATTQKVLKAVSS